MKKISREDLETKMLPASLDSTLYGLDLLAQAEGLDVSSARATRALEYANAIGGIATAVGYDPSKPLTQDLLDLNLRHQFGTQIKLVQELPQISQ